MEILTINWDSPIYTLHATVAPLAFVKTDIFCQNGVIVIFYTCFFSSFFSSTWIVWVKVVVVVISPHVHFHENQTHFRTKTRFETEARRIMLQSNFPTCKMGLSQAHARGSRFSVAESSDHLCMDRNLFSCQDNTAPPLEDQNDATQAAWEKKKITKERNQLVR